jgi:hypothetical protein
MVQTPPLPPKRINTMAKSRFLSSLSTFGLIDDELRISFPKSLEVIE